MPRSRAPSSSSKARARAPSKRPRSTQWRTTVGRRRTQRRAAAISTRCTCSSRRAPISHSGTVSTQRSPATRRTEDSGTQRSTWRAFARTRRLWRRCWAPAWTGVKRTTTATTRCTSCSSRRRGGAKIAIPWCGLSCSTTACPRHLARYQTWPPPHRLDG